MSDNESAAEDNEAKVDALVGVLQPLLAALDGLQVVGRYLHPPQLPALTARLEPLGEPLNDGLRPFRAVAWPDHQAGVVQCIETAADLAGRALAGMQEAVDHPDGIMQAYRSLRHTPRAMAALYPLAANLQPVSRFYLEPGTRDDADLIKRLHEAAPNESQVGVMHSRNDRRSRGGFSLYVPEYYDASRSYPLIMALHGGSGHGQTFLWTWLREARSRGAILVSPTSCDSTWSLMEPAIDSQSIEAILDHVREHWSIDSEKMLLTGMSDGGTFCCVSGLRDASPFTHLAPISASFHPMMLEMIEEPRIKDRPIHLTHGALDWMFAVDVARTANTVLAAAGAAIEYREIPDLSHTYPNAENGDIMDWFI
jgi:phospholipase/carboxylesterase